ncbi:MAG TPA: SIS domain-containing protein [Patescibacteria group bacterium]|nr:SIS domain-containing protein [Patescibacteria group bacterium]
MKHLLDSPSTYLRYDPSNAMNSLETLADQCEQAWHEVKKVDFSKSLKSLDRVVVCGMGGSDLGAYMIKSLFKRDLKVPFEIVHDYSLPEYVNNKTLVIAISYSGSTEEALSALKDARARKAKIAIIAGGKNLEASAKKNNIPAYIFDDSKNNVSRAPRMGVGLTLFGLVGIMKQLGYIKLAEKDALAAIDHMRTVEKKWNGVVPLGKNATKKLADVLHQKMPIYVASEHLWGNARIMRNQTHETCKTFAAHFDVPELNHHLMEGLAHPKEKHAMHFVLFPSKLYYTRIQKRYPITKAVIKKNGIDVSVVELEGKTRLAQALEALLFGGYVTFYMAMLNKLDPTPNPFVDFFKEQLKK